MDVLQLIGCTVHLQNIFLEVRLWGAALFLFVFKYYQRPKLLNISRYLMFVDFYWRITRYYFILARQKQYINRYILKKDFHSVSKEPLDKRRKFSHSMTVSKVYNYIYLWVITKTRNKQKQPEIRNYPQFQNWGNLLFSTNFFVFQTLSPNVPQRVFGPRNMNCLIF